MIILVDQDGVLADFEKAFLDRWRRLYPNAFFVPPEHRKGFYIEAQYPEEFNDKIKAIFNTPGFYAGMDPVPGGLEAFRKMLELGHEAFICTMPFKGNPTCATEKLDWVEKHLGTEFLSRVIITHDKTLVRGDVLIDDKVNIKGVMTPMWEQIIFDLPQNREANGRRRLDWTTYRRVLGI